MTDWFRKLGAGVALALPLAIAAPDAGVGAEDTFSPTQQKAIERIVRDYLVEHPEVIEDAIRALRARHAAEEEQRSRDALAAQKSAIYDNPMSPVSGNAGGDVTVVEFFDYQCGYCKRSLPAMVNLLKSDKKVRVIWKELPILGPVSEYAARAALAAARQDRYLDFHVGVMGLRGRLTEDRVMDVAAKIGLDVGQLQLDMKDPAITAYLNGNRELADTLGIRGTPAFIIGEQLVPGAIDAGAMKQLIAEARTAG